MAPKAKKSKCQVCGSAFTSNWHLKRHIKQVFACSDGSDTPTFDCLLCNKKFSREGKTGSDGLGRHLKSASHICRAMLRKSPIVPEKLKGSTNSTAVRKIVRDDLAGDEFHPRLSAGVNDTNLAGLDLLNDCCLSGFECACTGHGPRPQLASPHRPDEASQWQMSEGAPTVEEWTIRGTENLVPVLPNAAQIVDGAIITLPLRLSTRASFPKINGLGCGPPTVPVSTDADQLNELPDDPMEIGSLFGGSARTGSCQWSSTKSEISVHYKRFSDHQEMGAPCLFPVDEELRNGRLQTFFTSKVNGFIVASCKHP